MSDLYVGLCLSGVGLATLAAGLLVRDVRERWGAALGRCWWGTW